jgi:hypothetical protein
VCGCGDNPEGLPGTYSGILALLGLWGFRRRVGRSGRSEGRPS